MGGLEHLIDGASGHGASSTIGSYKFIAERRLALANSDLSIKFPLALLSIFWTKAIEVFPWQQL